MKAIWSKPTVQQMLELTKAALLGTIPDKSQFVDIGETDWNKVFELSVVQGVKVLCLNGAIRLPKELHPPLKLKLRWIAEADSVEKKYLHDLEVAKELSSLFRENNIRMLLFKGFALARLYPVPYSREFGDLDIYLFDKAKEGDTLLEHLIGKRYISSQKHVNYIYRGILIENHHTLLNQGKQRKLPRCEDMEKRLIKFLDETESAKTIIPIESSQTGEALLFPPPDFDALFVTLHLLIHLANRIVLRHLCDITVMFTAYKGKIDISLYRAALSETGLQKIADAIISLSVRYLGLKPEDAPPYESDLLLENKLWSDLINPEVPSLPKEKQNLFTVFVFKVRMLQSNYWKHKLIFPGQFIKRIYYSIIFRFKNPKVFGK